MDVLKRAQTLVIDAAIERAQTLPGWVYTHEDAFALHQQLLRRSWQVFPGHPPEAPALVPWTLTPQAVNEPLLLTHDGERLRCLSNVCTHRGAVLLEAPTTGSSIRCPYHGRRFALDGRLRSAPGFERCPAFPGPTDHLPELALRRFGPLAFTALQPSLDFERWLGPLRERLRGVVPESMRYAPEAYRVFSVDAHWALYCDNYLEGFHIPFVHPALHRALDADGYETTCFAWGSLQVGIAASSDTSTFALPADHPDHGRPIAAYYYWLFPNTMINVYPWGLSINAVLPRAVDKTDIVFFRYVWDPDGQDPDGQDRSAGSGLDTVELEDEAIVERTARGVRASLYGRGRYAPAHEQGVHHFHRLLAQSMAELAQAERPADASLHSSP